MTAFTDIQDGIEALRALLAHIDRSGYRSEKTGLRLDGNVQAFEAAERALHRIETGYRENPSAKATGVGHGAADPAMRNLTGSDTGALVIEAVRSALADIRGDLEAKDWSVSEDVLVTTYALGLDDLARAYPLRLARHTGWAVPLVAFGQDGRETGVAFTRPGDDGRPRFTSVSWGDGDTSFDGLVRAFREARRGDEVRLLQASAVSGVAAWIFSADGDRTIPFEDGTDPVAFRIHEGLPPEWIERALHRRETGEGTAP